MFDFFQNIFGKIISLTASAIIAVGLVSVPEIPKQPLPLEQPKEEVVLEIEKNKLKSELNINKTNRTNSEQLQIKTQALEEKIEQAERKISELERQRIEDEKEAEKIIEEELQKQADTEVQKQGEARKKVELEKRIIEENEAQRKAEEERTRQEYKSQLDQKIKSDISYFSNQISIIEQDVEQTAGGYYASMNKELSDYLNNTEFYSGLYKLDIINRHRAVLNEASKDIWTDCTELRRLWDYQNGDYQQYSIGLNNAERTLKSNINYVGNSYISDLNFLLNQIKEKQQKLGQYLNELNNSNVSDVGLLKNEVNNLISRLNPLEQKINEAKNYSISALSPSSVLSEIDTLIQEEKEWFAKTSCKNLI